MPWRAGTPARPSAAGRRGAPRGAAGPSHIPWPACTPWRGTPSLPPRPHRSRRPTGCGCIAARALWRGNQNAGQRHDPDFIGQQFARLNYNEAAAVPEAQTWV